MKARPSDLELMWVMVRNFSFLLVLCSSSLFNTIVLIWLGLTVLFNADRRTWGIWLAGLGLMVGGAFFVCHTATLDYDLEALIRGINSWWYLSWLCVITLPFGWYVLMLSYAGFWDSRTSELRRRHTMLFYLTGALMVALVLLIAVVNPRAFISKIATAPMRGLLQNASVPLLLVVYPVYVTLCVSLSLNVLYRPGPTSRVMGDIARRRARPWLIASTVVQLVISLIVCGTLLWLVWGLRHYNMGVFVNSQSVQFIAATDFAATTLVSVAVILMGKAIVSYEIFTGKTLPRQGFLRQWRSIIILAGAYSLLVSFAALRDWRAVYLIVLTTVLMSVFYAVFSWRSYTEREHYIGQLRPFVASQHLYDFLLAQEPASQPDGYARNSFFALCEQVLGARVAYLTALGPLRPLVGAPLGYPEKPDDDIAHLPEITGYFPTSTIMCHQLDPELHAGAVWAVPLWSERGLTGVLLLGDKRDGGIYSQEEIEIARASGERLIDTLASAALAQRLMALQRRRLAESQVLDRRARRTLHDDILPRLHTAMLSLSRVGEGGGDTGGGPALQEALSHLGDAHRQISNLLREMPATAAPEVSRLGLLGALHQVVEKELPGAFERVNWNASPLAETAAAQLSSLGAEVLFYAAREAIRNAARYGRPAGDNRHLHLTISLQCEDEIMLVVEDNGVGLDPNRGSDGGSGQGLILHSTMMAVVGGSLATESVLQQFTRVTLTLPLSSTAGTTH